MRKFFILSISMLIVFMSTFLNAQKVPLNKTFDLSQTMADSVEQSYLLDADFDGFNDFEFTYWSGHSVGNTAAVRVTSLNTTSSLKVKNSCDIMVTCENGNTGTLAQTGYIYTSECPENAGLKNYIMIFGTKSLLLYTEIFQDSVHIYGFYVFPDHFYNCNPLNTPELSLGSKTFGPDKSGKPKLFNLLGQPANENDKGTLILEYPSGVIEKIYKH